MTMMTCLRWFVHVQRTPVTVLVMTSLSSQVDGLPRKRGRPKRTLMEVSRLDPKRCKLSEDLGCNRVEWRNEIKIGGIRL